jgi:peroxiredoxin Q/BCP
VGHTVAEAYGVWGERTVGERTFTGTHRVTFLINPNGHIARVWGSVTPTGHAAEVLAEITAQRG